MLILRSDGLEQLRHQLLKADHFRRQGHVGLLLGFQLAGVEAVFLARGKTFVVGILANGFQLIQRQGFDVFQCNLFAFGRHLLAGFDHRLGRLLLFTGLRRFHFRVKAG